MEAHERSLEETPTWAVSFVCLVLIILSILIEGTLNLLTKFLKRKKLNSLNRALGKIKTELMILGFISLLLSVAEVPITKICVTETIGDSFLPCKDSIDSEGHSVSAAISRSNATVSDEKIDDSSCEAKGMVSLLSREAIEQLHIFIFVLAVFHVLYCVLTMCLGQAKMRRWKSWEEETRSLEYQIANDPRRFRLTRQTSFGRRHLKCWSDNPLSLWLVCFLRQFNGSISKADYFTLRNGFIVAHLAEGGSDFHFQKFLARVYHEDFEQVVGISFWIWIFSIVFIFFSAHGFYNYLWLPFIPLLIVLTVSTKLEVIITKMCLESRQKTTIIQGAFLVEPNDNLFWFGRPKWLLHLIHFTLFQNSFQLAFFTWTSYEYGLRSCFHQKTEDIILRVVMGVLVQFLCGYVTLPLYALVTQMGSSMKTAVFTERVAKGLKNWHNVARRNLSRTRSNSSKHSFECWPAENTEASSSSMELGLQEFSHLPPLAHIESPTPESTDKAAHHKISAKGAYDGDISFGTSLGPETTDEAALHRIIAEGNYDGEISFGVSPRPESIDEAEQHKIIAKEAYDGEISFGVSPRPPSTDEAACQMILPKGNYDGEVSFGTTWKDLENGNEIKGIAKASDDDANEI